MANKILIAVELDELSANTVLAGACSLVRPEDQCQVIHVLDPASLRVLFDATIEQRNQKEYEQTAVRHAQDRLLTLITPHELPNVTGTVCVGRVAKEIQKQIRAGGFDQLMIGSHGWHGWQRLLGSHAAGIVSTAPVDVWIFKIPES